MKQTLAVWEDSSSESDKAEKDEDVSMLAVEECEVTSDSLFVVMANTEDDEKNVVTLSTSRKI